MNKKENRMTLRQEVQKSVIRDEQNRRIQFAATNPINEVLKNLHTTLWGLDEDSVSVTNDSTSRKGNFTFGLRKELERRKINYSITNVNSSVEQFAKASMPSKPVSYTHLQYLETAHCRANDDATFR